MRKAVSRSRACCGSSPRAVSSARSATPSGSASLWPSRVASRPSSSLSFSACGSVRGRRRRRRCARNYRRPESAGGGAPRISREATGKFSSRWPLPLRTRRRASSRASRRRLHAALPLAAAAARVLQRGFVGPQRIDERDGRQRQAPERAQADRSAASAGRRATMRARRPAHPGGGAVARTAPAAAPARNTSAMPASCRRAAAANT